MLRRLTKWIRTPSKHKSEQEDFDLQKLSDDVDLRLIVGLGNPGSRYAQTRHNVGERWVRELADRFAIPLRLENKFNAYTGRGDIVGTDIRLLVPTTYMNRSGNAVGPYARYFKIAINQVLVVYDEVAFDVGTCKLKIGGGHNGHNGLQSVFDGFSNNREFARLRIGVGHPGDPRDVTAYLTDQNMPDTERELCETSSHLSDDLLRFVVRGDWQRAMTLLHSN